MGDDANRLTALGRNATRFSTVDAQAIAHEALEERFAPSGPRGVLGKGDKACTLSHLTVVDRLPATGADWALLLEIDVRIAKDLPEALADLSLIPDGAEIVTLEVCLTRNLLLLPGRPWGRTPSGRVAHPLPLRHPRGAGYMISRLGGAGAGGRGPRLHPDRPSAFNANASGITSALRLLLMRPAMVEQVGGAMAPILVRSAAERRPRAGPVAGARWSGGFSRFA